MTGPLRTWRFEEFELDEEAFELRKAGTPVAIQAKPLALLVHLVRNHGRLVTHEEIVRTIWSDVVVSEASIATALRQARRALGDDARAPRFIETLRAHGLRFVADVAEAPGPTRHVEQAPAEGAPLSAIAVLPFDDLSPSSDLQWFTEGLAEDLIDSLSRIEGLRVPAGNSTAILKEQRADPLEIGRRLETGSLLTGAVRQVGDRFLVTVRWIRIEDQTSIWSARFERPFENVLEIQHELAEAFSEVIRRELGIRDTAEFVSSARYHTSDVRAWEAFRRGFRLIFTFKPWKMTEGREHLQKALEIDPSYLEARAWLAWSDFDRPDRRNAESLRVLDQQASNPTALHALVEDSVTQWDFATAERLWRYAVANNPVNSALTLKGFHLTSCLGALEETLEVTRRGVRIDPLWPTQHFFLGLALLNLGEPDAAIDPILRAISLRGEIGDASGLALDWAYQYLAIVLQSAGRESAAIDALSEGFPGFRDDIAKGAAADGWHGANLSLLRALGDFPEGHPFRFARARFRATILASIGEREAMYAQLRELMEATVKYAVRDREALRNTEFLTEYFRANAEFRPYRDEAEFKALKQQLDDRISRAAGAAGYAHLIR